MKKIDADDIGVIIFMLAILMIIFCLLISLGINILFILALIKFIFN